MLLRALPLFLMIFVGSACGALRLFDEPEKAIGVLNRLALYVCFPALIVAGLADPDLRPPEGAGFYVAHVVSFVGVLAALWVLTARGRLRSERGTIVLCTVFGNIAYLGIPICARLLGAEVTGLASLSAAIHVALAMTLGPALFVVGNGVSTVGGQSPLGAVLRQPLVWSPVLGLALRWPLELSGTSSVAAAQVLELVRGLGAAAGPVALFMLGLYLWENRRSVLSLNVAGVTVLATKLALYPALALGVTVAIGFWLPVTDAERAVLVLMAAMPCAVTTFSIAEEFGHGQATAAGAILVSTLISLASLPLLAGLLARL